MLSSIAVAILALVARAAPQATPTQTLPLSGENGQMGGIFGISLGGTAKGGAGTASFHKFSVVIITDGSGKGLPSMLSGGIVFGPESPKREIMDDGTPGTGPYPAYRFTDPTLKNHTIYAPKTPPKGVKLPVLIFGNGGCGNSGSGFTNLLTEIASHGYLAIANGPPANTSMFKSMGGAGGTGMPKFPMGAAMPTGFPKGVFPSALGARPSGFPKYPLPSGFPKGVLPSGFKFPSGAAMPTGFKLPAGMARPTGFKFPAGMAMPTGFKFPAGIAMPTGSQFPSGVAMPTGLPKLPGGGRLGGMMAGSSVSQMTDAVDWVVRGGASKYGDIDTTKIAASGQSCGGLQAYSASYHDDRIKLTILFNSGVIDDNKVYLLKELKAPIAYFIGGPKDIAYPMAERDWVNIPQKLPALKMNLDTGHMGTYFAPNAGKFGNASVAFLNWFFRGDIKAKAMFFDKDSQLVKDNWNISTRNW